MPGVGVDPQLRVREVTREQAAVLGDHHRVVVPVRYQRRLGDRCEASELRRIRDPPAGDRLELGVAGCEVGRFVAIDRARGDAPEELHALGAALLGAREEQPNEAVRVESVRRGERVDLVRPAVDPRRAPRCGAGEHEPADQPRTHQRQLLGDIAAEREAEHVDLGQPERVDEAQHVAGHVLDVVRNRTGRGADAAVVEQDDLALLRDAVDERGIPGVEVAPEVLQEEQRRRLALDVAEAPVDERLPVDFHRAVPGGQRVFTGHCGAHLNLS